MRQIKFRAWDKKSKEMFQVRSVDAFGSVICFTTGEEQYKRLQEFIKNPENTGVAVFPSEVVFAPSKDLADFRVEIMQFTGLTDKNSKEVYEGDIIRCVFPIEDKEMMGDDQDSINEVRYSEKDAMFIQFAKGRITDSLESTGMCTIEVIGNIYENKELLK